MALRTGRTLGGDLRRAARNPGLAWNYLRRWSLLATYAGVPKAEIVKFRRAFQLDSFQTHLVESFGATRGAFGRAAELYVLVRALQPDVVVETGVASGVSSAHLLLAMAENGKGTLHSIDLPNVGEGVALPPGKAPGWIVPDQLRDRWDLQLGDSRDLLPKLLGSLKWVDIFFHDSDHSKESMIFEFEAALPKVRAGGLILSDDTNYNDAWDEFCARHALVCNRVVHMGVTRKP
jgi:transposase-like protein